MPATRNLFFALAPDPPLRAALAAHARRLHAEWDGRMTAAAKLHMTLLFLDALPAPIEQTVLDAARAAGASAAATHRAFDLVVDRAGRFERRVGWLAAGAPVRRENHYTPHVTALRDPRKPEPHAIDPLHWHVAHFELMASAEGAYEVLGRWPLQPA